MTGPELLAILIALYVVWWVLSRWLWPYGPCWWPWCDRGRNAGSNKKRWGRCWRCGGSGEQWRFGARMFHKAARAARGRKKR
jgi:hypothetical protein